MNIIDYYHKFLRCFNIKLIKSKELINTLISYNNYLYVYDKQLRGPKTITIFEDESNCIFKYLCGSHTMQNTYMVYIPYEECMLMLELNTSQEYYNLYLHLYNDKYVFTCIHPDVWSMISFLELDRLNEVMHFIEATLQVIHNTQIRTYTNGYINKYVSQHTSLIEQSMDHYLRRFSLLTSGDRYYIIYSYPDKKLFLNINDNNEHSVDNNSQGQYLGTIYYFEIDKERSILVVMTDESEDIKICLYKYGTMIFETIPNFTLKHHLKMIFSLLNKKDMYEYIKQIKFL